MTPSSKGDESSDEGQADAAHAPIVADEAFRNDPFCVTAKTADALAAMPRAVRAAASAAATPAARAAADAARAATFAAARAAAPAAAPAVAPAVARAAAPAAATPAATAPDAAERHEATLLMSRVLRGGDVPELIDGVIFVFDEIGGYSVSWSLQVLSAYGTSHIPCASNGSRVL